MAGPEVVRICAPSSAATMLASVVFPRPGRAVEQDVVDRFGAMPRGVDEDRQVFLDPLLPGELVEPPGSDGRLEGELLWRNLGGGHPLDGHAASGVWRMDTAESNM